MSESRSTDNDDPGLTANEKVGHWIEMWKQTTQVQQHFNDIEWRIRGLALTAATFTVGAAALAVSNGARFVAPGLLLIGLILWYAFYFVDRYWYHQLLLGSVEQGKELEQLIGNSLSGAGLALAISEQSPVPKPWVIKALSFGQNRDVELRSSDKLRWFYTLGGLALLLAALALLVLALVTDPEEESATGALGQSHCRCLSYS